MVNEGDLPWTSFGRGRYTRQTKRLSARAGSVGLGLRLERLDPGHSDFPLHWHVAEEEGFIGISGAAGLVQTDHDGEHETRTPFGADDAVVFPPDRRVAHRFDVPDDADAPFMFLVFGDRSPLDLGGFPRRNAWIVRKGTQGAVDARKDGLGMFSATPIDYYHGLPDADAPVAEGGSSSETILAQRFGHRDDPSPPSYSPVIHTHDIAPRTFGKDRHARSCTQLAPHIGATRFDLNIDEIPIGHVDSPLHHHLGDEECFYILDGHGVLRTRGPAPSDSDHRTPVGPGDCISFPAATGIAHQIGVPRDAKEPLRMITLATRAPVDVVHMTESKKWIIKRSDLDRAALKTYGSAIVRDVRADWLDDEPMVDL